MVQYSYTSVPEGQQGGTIIYDFETFQMVFQFFYEIKLGGAEQHRKENRNPKSYSNVKVYAADPWHPEVNGTIRNLFVCGTGKCFFKLKTNCELL